ncbi:MAG: 16S rRNA (guanine(966)-N(2))-methyltransferase RsmD [Bacteroidetes bacterium]|nr:MAG: 16S rRNA (guanine(966)-N(2))-methyltransferase RsmD [Bacteroidota bacterium]
MRIIGGTYKRKIIEAPKNLPVRPTTDMAKEALFNILNNRFVFSQITALDLFSGTGNLAFELASRGVQKVVAVDKHAGCVAFIKKIKNLLNFYQMEVIKQDAFKFLHQTDEQFDLILADPPYDMKFIHEIPELVFQNHVLSEKGLLIVEHGSETDLSEQKNYLYTKKYSRVHFSFFSYE